MMESLIPEWAVLWAANPWTAFAKTIEVQIAFIETARATTDQGFAVLTEGFRQIAQVVESGGPR